MKNWQKLDFKNIINKHAVVEKHRDFYANTREYTFVLRTYKTL